MAKGPLGAFKGFDAFGKTLEDVKIKTRTGGLLTIISITLILSFTLMEFIDFRRVNTDTSIIVDRSRGEKLSVVFNITFPKVPCYLVSADVTDISGDYQTNIMHNVFKTRLMNSGQPVPEAEISKELKSDLDMAAKTRGPNFCGSCYGGVEPETGCCQTCEDVRQAYLNRGWSFSNPDAIDQCVAEHWTEKIKAQSSEGCNVAGRIDLNKVVGNLMLWPGKSFQQSGMGMSELVPYLKEGEPHHWGHSILQFYFQHADERWKPKERQLMKEKLGVHRYPLERHYAHARNPSYMFQYFLKVVGTRYHFLDGNHVRSHEYSVTTYERDLSQGSSATNAQGITASRGSSGQPGAFFNFEISPMLVVHTETRQSFAHFLTSLCAIIGGVLTIASILDSVVFNASQVLKKNGGSSSSYGGKLM
ncbi:endoplasmic reticulum-derived transport vesicle ERV46 [Cantharellus anzutake]|uniref:endoplasmic reticulum-derived transport vesicle ERV46 n=1 Tax=Cantharellus anzutake TaxID=1750568 RepID=UPI001906CB90|nr:endoplasmic reticulum-derived transport vesicle ERV46 [Cantharellus anzutake]KAF8339744.1 endoplasmic reticulum-derived transport vesicle ERV46 [Cantharellus anzutake]